MADQEETLKRSPSQEKYGRVQYAIKILFLIVFVGWIFIWIMLPTNTNREKWLPKLGTKINSTYYGTEGASFLIYTSPVLLMSVLGCVYLHIAKKSNDSNLESYNVTKLDVAILKRPILVKGPLGIVSGTQLAFLLMFIALIIWSFATYLHNGFATITPQLAAKDGEKIGLLDVCYGLYYCLLYAMVCTRPDLAQAVSQVCKYMSKPGKQHWEAVKWIFRYLKGTTGLGIMFGSQHSKPSVIGYVDSDYAGDLDDRRSTMGFVFTLVGGSIIWRSSVQSVIAMSTIEAGYMAAGEASKEAMWLMGLVNELGIEQGGVPLHCDSQSAIFLAKNQVYHARTKHN
ncbi:hypothetical protein TanjilG_28396 [Lupinus angustifolius]|uniref:Reverse transcriptase Ty1/copia-type domain-containing protein n=1 Tax=Lupinus angustifolius TaxID=3871 RepID=A0A1J7GP08_LUPAN|nr:hypothetical protein TanjilG_28396 [Lupinus angustifolius]